MTTGKKHPAPPRRSFAPVHEAARGVSWGLRKVRGEGGPFGWADAPLLRSVRYKAYLMVFIVGAIASSFSWFLADFEGTDAFNRVVYPLMTLFCAVLAAVLWWRGARALRFSGMVGYTVASVFLLAKSYHAFYVAYGPFH